MEGLQNRGKKMAAFQVVIRDSGISLMLRERGGEGVWRFDVREVMH